MEYFLIYPFVGMKHHGATYYFCSVMSRKPYHYNMNILAVSLALLVYGSLLANHMVYYHTHITHDGTLISHAHPYDKAGDSSPIKKHHHTSIDLLLFLGDGYYIYCTAQKVFRQIDSVRTTFCSFAEKTGFQPFCYIDKQRGPPASNPISCQSEYA